MVGAPARRQLRQKKGLWLVPSATEGEQRPLLAVCWDPGHQARCGCMHSSSPCAVYWQCRVFACRSGVACCRLLRYAGLQKPLGLQHQAFRHTLCMCDALTGGGVLWEALVLHM
jgi:hypothetical protein